MFIFVVEIDLYVRVYFMMLIYLISLNIARVMLKPVKHFLELERAEFVT